MRMNSFKNKFVTTNIVALALIFTLPSFAQSVKQELRTKLAQLQPFSASFTQTVTSAEGKQLLTAEGSMKIQRPNQFRWHTVTPDEQLIVSNGETLWFYNPFVEQVSIYSLQDAIANTPFMLIAGAKQELWDSYQVSKQAGLYRVITPNDDSASVFTLSFSQDKIAEFSVQEQQGQNSHFKLMNYGEIVNKNGKLFSFVIPENTDIDDQR